MPKIRSLDDLLVMQLRDLYSAEKQLLQNLPRMAKKVSHDDLRKAFEKHAKETEQQKLRLEKIGTILEFKPGGHTCAAMKGLIEEAKEFLEDAEDAPEDVIDAGLIANAQRIEHYEIAGYGTVRALADLLGYANVVKLIEQTLAEEKKTDQLLTDLALSTVNADAAASEE